LTIGISIDYHSCFRFQRTDKIDTVILAGVSLVNVCLSLSLVFLFGYWCVVCLFTMVFKPCLLNHHVTINIALTKTFQAFHVNSEI